MKIVSFIINNALYVSILLILISSLIGIYIKSRSRDRCLRNFSGYKITLETSSGKLVWGILDVFGTGLELNYQSGHHDYDGHIENSYILYNAEFDNIVSLYRYHYQLSEINKLRRKTDIEKTYIPNLFRISLRKARNFFNTFRDGVTQIVSLIIGSFAAAKPQAVISQKQKDLSGLSSELITSISHAYDPILEKYIGQYVVAESVLEDSKREFCGILKEYTNRFIEILNASIPETVEITCIKDEKLEVIDQISIERTEKDVTLRNNSPYPVYLKSFSSSAWTHPVDVYIDIGKAMTVDYPEITHDALLITFNIPRKVDLVLPRSRFCVRHGGKLEKDKREELLELTIRST
ncbi:hypothetical protein JW979_12440 [bacterium]|nr:hypothetical protein [candidate division CSSED10-310 bacterium]